jgi:hypothetical protein
MSHNRVEYCDVRALRESDQWEHTIDGRLDAMGELGWEAWHMENILNPGGTPSNHVRIYFRRTKR